MMYLLKLINYQDTSCTVKSLKGQMIVDAALDKNIEKLTPEVKARRLYHYICKERLPGLVLDIGFDRPGQKTLELPLPNEKVMRVFPESYNSFVLYSLLTKLINGSILIYTDSTSANSSIGVILSMISGCSCQKIQDSILHGDPELTKHDLVGSYYFEENSLIWRWHPRITDKELDILVNDLDRMPPKAISVLGELIRKRVIEMPFEDKFFPVENKSVFATVSSDSSKGRLMSSSRYVNDIFPFSIWALQPNVLYDPRGRSDLSAPIPAKYQLSRSEIDRISVDISALQVSPEAIERLEHFFSTPLLGERALSDIERFVLANISLIEPGIKTILQYAQALAWFRGKTRVDHEEIAEVIVPVSLHLIGPHIESNGLLSLRTSDIQAQIQRLWKKAMEQYDKDHLIKDEPSFKTPVSAFFSDECLAKSEIYKNFKDLERAAARITDTGHILATIYKSMEQYARSSRSRDFVSEELESMKILFYEYYYEGSF